MPLFSNIDDLQTYVNNTMTANGSGDIMGPENNTSLSGCIEFIRKCPLNWQKAAVHSNGGVVDLQDDYVGVIVFTTVTPDVLAFDDNIYHEYVFANMTNGDIQLGSGLFYYNMSGVAQDSIPANICITIFKAANDLWFLGSTSAGGGGGSTQRQPLLYVVGTTLNAPTAGQSTWTLPAFEGAYVAQLLINSFPVDIEDAGDGSEYITKDLNDDTLTINNRGGGWNNGDKLQYILLVP